MAASSDIVIYVGGNHTRADHAGSDRATLDLTNH